MKMVKKVTKTVKKKSILDRIIDVGDAPTHDSMLVYGRAGTGKTEFGSTFPTPVLLLDIREEGYKTVKKKPGIRLLQIETWDELEEIYWELHGGLDYESVVIDQVTAMQALAMAGVREELGMKPSETLSQRSWGKISGRMQEWLFNFRELTKKGYNVCFLAHERLRDANEEDDERIAPSVGANLMPSIASYLNGAVSVIGNSFIRERVDKKEKTRHTEFCMRVGAHPYYAAKIRRPVASGPAPDVIVNPTYEKVMKIAEGESNVRKVKKVSK
jgi:hypothetical protein